MKYAKRVLAAALTGAMLITSAFPVMAQNTASSMSLSAAIKHGTDRSKVVTEDMVNNTPPADYTIPEGVVQEAKDGLYDKYFLKDDLQTVSVEIEEDNLNYMLQNAKEKPSVMTTSVTIGDTKVGYAGIKTKGNYTLSHTFTDYDSDRFSFTINFGKYIKKKQYGAKQNFYGCNKISFNNFFFDRTAMKEYNAMRLMTEMGVPTSQYGLAKLYINGQYYGVYFMVEAMDSSILEQHMGVSSKKISDYLTKPVNTNFRYDKAFDAYKAEDGTFTMDSLSSILNKNEEGTYVADSQIWQTGIWEEDDDTLQDVAEMLPTVLTWEEKLTNLSEGKDFSGSKIDVNSQEYLDLLEQIMDTDEALRYFATHSFVVQLDNMFTNSQNFGLYVDENGKSMLIPWDYDIAWGSYLAPNNAQDVANFDLDKIYNTELWRGNPGDFYKQFPLFYVLYQNKTLLDKYHKYMEDCAKIASIGGTTSDGRFFAAGRYAATIDVLQGKISAAMSEPLASNVYYINSDTWASLKLNQPGSANAGIPNIKKIIALRSVGVWLQTNSINSLVTRCGCDMSTTGNAQMGRSSYLGNLTVVDAQTGIFANAAYYSNTYGTPVLRCTEYDASNGVYQKMAAAFDQNITVYHMTDGKQPGSPYELYLPIDSNGKNVKIYSYTESSNKLTELPATVIDNHLYRVSTTDISNIVITQGTKMNLAAADVTVADAGVYDGTAKTPAVNVSVMGNAVAQSQYTVSYSNNVNAGTASVTVTANGDSAFTGGKTVSFAIAKASNSLTVKEAAITKSASGKKQSVTINATAKSGTVTYQSSDRKVTVSGNGKVTLPKKYAGTVTITVNASGDVNHESAAKKVTITVPGTATLKTVKNSAAKKAKAIWKKKSGVTGYEVMYASNRSFSKAKTVKVKGASKTSAVISKLKKGKTYYVRVRTYKTVSGKNYTSLWSGVKKVKIKKY